MISLHVTPQLRFDLRAAAVVHDRGRVLLHRADWEPFWSLPGGRVEAGEAGPDAVVRELQEELGETVEVEHHLWTIENFFEWQGRRIHEIGLYFRCRPHAGSRLLTQPGPYKGVEGEDVLHFAWFDQAELAGLTVHPPLLATLLAEQPPRPGHHVQRPWPRPVEAS
ncbi:MAG TPA: NUDIX domain-containing protein [Ramlibacter sp.]|nr:NUDIX domain-containing protein [Ramlibacter sp.]